MGGTPVCKPVDDNTSSRHEWADLKERIIILREDIGVTILCHAALPSALRSRVLPSQDTRDEAS